MSNAAHLDRWACMVMTLLRQRQRLPRPPAIPSRVIRSADRDDDPHAAAWDLEHSAAGDDHSTTTSTTDTP